MKKKSRDETTPNISPTESGRYLKLCECCFVEVQSPGVVSYAETAPFDVLEQVMWSLANSLGTTNSLINIANGTATYNSQVLSVKNCSDYPIFISGMNRIDLLSPPNNDGAYPNADYPTDKERKVIQVSGGAMGAGLGAQPSTVPKRSSVDIILHSILTQGDLSNTWINLVRNCTTELRLSIYTAEMKAYKTAVFQIQSNWHVYQCTNTTPAKWDPTKFKQESLAQKGSVDVGFNKRWVEKAYIQGQTPDLKYSIVPEGTTIDVMDGFNTRVVDTNREFTAADIWGMDCGVQAHVHDVKIDGLDLLVITPLILDVYPEGYEESGSLGLYGTNVHMEVVILNKSNSVPSPSAFSYPNINLVSIPSSWNPPPHFEIWREIIKWQKTKQDALRQTPPPTSDDRGVIIGGVAAGFLATFKLLSVTASFSGGLIGYFKTLFGKPENKKTNHDRLMIVNMLNAPFYLATASGVFSNVDSTRYVYPGEETTLILDGCAWGERDSSTQNMSTFIAGVIRICTWDPERQLPYVFEFKLYKSPILRTDMVYDFVEYIKEVSVLTFDKNGELKYHASIAPILPVLQDKERIYEQVINVTDGTSSSTPKFGFVFQCQGGQNLTTDVAYRRLSLYSR